MNRRRLNIKFKVGAFIFLGIACIAVYVIFMGNNQTVFQFTSTYKISFPEVHGLFSGSLVTVNGISAGNVESITFMENTGNVQVVVSLLQKFSASITDQSEASLNTKGLLGDKYVSIITQGKTGDKLPQNSYIPTKTSKDIMGLFGDEGEADRITSILNETLIFLKSINSEDTAKNINSAFQNISATFSARQSKEFSEILKRLNSILTKIDDGEGTAGALINNKNIYNRILSFLGQRPYHEYLPNLVQSEEDQQ